MSDEDKEKPFEPEVTGVSPELMEYLSVSPVKKLKNGIASGSLGLLRTDAPFPEPEKYPEVQSDGVWGIHLKELQTDYGIQLCGKVLLGAPEFGQLESRPISEIASEISEKLEPNEWENICRWAAKYASQHQGHHDVYLRAIWVREFETPLSAVWLAATAMHARFIEQNDFAYGYLIALLDQKLGNEQTYISGEKSNAGASSGGIATSANSEPKRKSVVREMARLLADNPNVSRAAEIAAKRGIGTSKGANRELWRKHGPK